MHVDRIPCDHNITSVLPDRCPIPSAQSAPGRRAPPNLEHFMRICVFALALVALAQPAFARSHHQAHHARVYYAHHTHHAARARVRLSEPGMVQAFVRTDATDRPFFSDPSFPNRGWRQPQFAYRNQFAYQDQFAYQSQFADQSWAQPTQSFGFGEAAPRVRATRAVAVRNTALDAMIPRHAAANGLPVELVHRVVKRESGYNPRASSRGNFGLMQIRYATARGVGYGGSASGLLDPETNLTYAVRYLAGAYRAAGGNASRAVAYYASGYHGRGVRQPAPTQLAWAREAAPRQVASAQPSWEMQSAPVLMRGDAMFEPRVPARYRRS